MSADLLTILDPPAIEPGGILSQTGSLDDERAETYFATPDGGDDFDWLTDDSVIIPEQPTTAVYRNRANAVVIRQEARGYDDDRDHFVILAGAAEVRTLIAALQRELRG